MLATETMNGELLRCLRFTDWRIHGARVTKARERALDQGSRRSPGSGIDASEECWGGRVLVYPALVV